MNLHTPNLCIVLMRQIYDRYRASRLSVILSFSRNNEGEKCLDLTVFTGYLSLYTVSIPLRKTLHAHTLRRYCPVSARGLYKQLPTMILNRLLIRSRVRSRQLLDITSLRKSLQRNSISGNRMRNQLFKVSIPSDNSNGRHTLVLTTQAVMFTFPTSSHS